MPLPAVNPAEDLETISRNKLSLLLDTVLFEVRPEIQRDKGIDLVVELKQDSSYTNFRFAVQLKSTNATEPNKDGSISCPVDVANINYLLNYGMPAYYILYDHSTGKFFVEAAYKIFQSLIKKHSPDSLPGQFSARFSELLTPESITKIYNSTLENGILLRRLNSHINHPAANKSLKGILIDETNDVYSVEQNIAFIDHYGFELLNKHQFKRIIEIEERTHPRATATPIFNFVCGMAYFQHASLLKAFEFLKAAQLSSREFDHHQKTMLTYTLLQAKNMLGMIDEAAFRQGIADLLQLENLGSYLGVEKAYAAFFESKEPDESRIGTLFGQLAAFIAQEPEITGLRIRCYAIILEIEGKSLLHALQQNFVLLCGRVPDLFATNTYKQWHKLEEEHEYRMMSLFNYSLDNQNFAAVGNITCDLLSWDYQKVFIFHTLKNWDAQSMRVHRPVSEEGIKFLESLADQLVDVVEGYRIIDHIENMVYALSLQYEILHFAGKMEEAGAVAAAIEMIIEEHNLNALKTNLKNLLKGDLRHTRFINGFTAQINELFRIADNSGIGQYVKYPIPAAGVEYIERGIKWPKHIFFELDFPAMENPSAL